MLETKDLILDKAKPDDWKGMYKNVWSHHESAKYMLWNVTRSEEDAVIRIKKTIEYQKSHTTYLVYEKTTGKPIGFAGFEEISPGLFRKPASALDRHIPAKDTAGRFCNA